VQHEVLGKSGVDLVAIARDDGQRNSAPGIARRLERDALVAREARAEVEGAQRAQGRIGSGVCGAGAAKIASSKVQPSTTSSGAAWNCAAISG
jgi:hypothetical protein